MKRVLAFFMMLLILTTTACAETIRTYGLSWHQDARALLKEKYPDLKVKAWEWDADNRCLTTAEFAGPLQTRSFDWDVFSLDHAYADARLLMAKGYLLDLSENAQVREIISRAHPVIADECMYDGKIYALPVIYRTPLYLEYVDMENWLAAGFTREDIPTTFPQFLDFIERYLDRLEEDPDFEYLIFAFDQARYSKRLWAFNLADMFLDNYAIQCSYAGEPQRFDDPAVIKVMERIWEVCERLDRLHPLTSGDVYDPPTLFTSDFPGWDKLEETRVDLRLSEDQPRLTPMSLTLLVVNAATNQPELATDFAVAEFQAEMTLFPEFAGLTFQDAQPVRDPSFEENYQHALNMIALCERRLAGDDTPIAACIVPTEDIDYGAVAERLEGMEERAVQDDLDQWRWNLDFWQAQQWRISLDELEAYKAMTDELYFIEPSIFDTTQGSQENIDRLFNQFCDGRITARELCGELNRIARMMEMENQ